ncbi:MAG TPA: prolyl oligopeptidase family serine peptidase [Fimbriimonadaceae bacterium]|nr:prolyl oligopeptidase family serine peptidase [Fimbriimonadaceae bacterium]
MLGKRLALLASALLVCAASYATNDEDTITKSGYLRPGGVIEKLVTAPRNLNVSLDNLSPDGEHFLIRVRPTLQSIDDMSKKWYNLGGWQIDPGATRSRALTTSANSGLEIFDWKTKQRWSIQVPKGATTSGETWSPDGKTLAFFANFDDASYLYTAEVSSGKVKRLSRRQLLATFVTAPQWTDNGDALVAVFRPDHMGPEPNQPGVNDIPFLKRTDPRKNELRTYASLLTSPEDEALVEYYSTGQLAKVSLSGRMAEIGETAMIESIDPNPAGGAIRVTTMQKPFSRIVPVSNFGNVENLWNEKGESLVELNKRELQLGGDENEDVSQWMINAGYDAEQFGRGGFRGRGSAGEDGRRQIEWRKDGSGLSFLQREPADKDNPGKKRKDRVMLWKAPYGKDDVQTVYSTDDSISFVDYGQDGHTIFVTTTRNGHNVLYAVTLDGDQKPMTIYDYQSGPDVQGPGSLVRQDGLVTMNNGHVWLSGTETPKDTSKDAPRPFLDSVTIETGEKTRVWQSAKDVYETVQEFVSTDGSQVVIERQSPTMVPDSYLLDVGSGNLTKLTENKDYSPEMTETIKQRFRVTRADGFSFWVNITLPKSWNEGDKLPAFFWFYPSEYTDQASYDRADARYNKNRWINYGTQSKQYLTQLGYAVVEPDCPIVGDEGRMNDNYVHDLLQDLSAVIDACEAKGMIDRTRLGIGGHSYGAFGTANALVHTPFFKAGIAGDGNYNRTLTPMRFQRESRLLYQARETYFAMSPLLHAEDMTGALLMYHGMEDQNVGTNPIHAHFMFHMLESIGKDAALYMYPQEDHGQRAEASVLDMWTRWIAWLDKYVKNAGKTEEKKDDGGK